MRAFNEYVVFVDESGDHGMLEINSDYPVFVLVFCVFKKDDYIDKIVPALTRLKYDVFGHDMLVLHEHEIRKKGGPFGRMGKTSRENFMEKLNQLVINASFVLIAVVIKKSLFSKTSEYPQNPYACAMKIGLERIFEFLRMQKQADKELHLIFESRGHREDNDLQQEFLRIRSGQNDYKRPLPFQIIFADKKANAAGLQFADMMARPIGLSVIRPNQPNRAMDILRAKFLADSTGKVEGYGMNVLP